ncbi:trypsin-like peptidase domain-containing protein [Natrinema zhouii]|uniref:Trypsin-like peptidase domain-containing protein n=1 Tax=Natrinema zhouii TaxID=1710539 RepID=A0A7D6GRC6_9EURY|nr:trypsin-like peptidase domain-containing protein [Natrinema zhouii]QLK26442.1 trypsin-like peptidase domain-containing protein [Natrinema zhouii]
MGVTPDQRTRRRVLRAVGATAAIGGLGVGSSAAQNGQDGQSGQGDDGVDSPYTATYRDTIGSVVLVTVSGPRGGGGLGSGFVIDEQHVVTNNHVVQSATEGGVELQFSNEEWRTASIVATDPYSDLAVLRVEELPDGASGLSIVDREPAIGQEVLVLGNPLGLDASISQGIVSGVDRVLPSPVGFSIPAAIQTDASVNPGNSGGPLVSLEGEVLGVVFAGADQTIGFAISSRLANRVIPALIEDGTYEHPFLGVGVQPVVPDIAEAVGLESATGVLVTEVVPNAPADGVLQPAVPTRPGSGDVIVAIDGEEVQNQSQLLSYLALETSPGDTVELTVVRDGEQESVEVTLETRPESQLPQTPIPGTPGERPPTEP